MSEKEIRPIDANAAIEKLRANFQQGSWYGCEEPCYQIAEDTIAEMPTIYAAPSGDPLTLDQLREMDGKPVWAECIKKWGIADAKEDVIAFPGFGVLHFRTAGKSVYAYPPAHIDREAWKAEWKNHYKSGVHAGTGAVCSSCDVWNDRKTHICPFCGKAMDEDGLAMLEKRLRG